MLKPYEPGPSPPSERSIRTSERFLAELIGTFTLVFAGAGSVCVSRISESGMDLVGIALAFGLAAAGIISAVGHVSGGHINPAVTLAMTATGRLSPKLAGVYFAAQLLGAVLAAAALRAVVPQEAWRDAQLGATALAPATPLLAGLLLETVLTFLLVSVVFGTAVDERTPKVGALYIGGIIAVAMLIAVPITGASINPARSFGPALMGGSWTDHWIYWVGPLAGGLAAGVVYDRLVAPGQKAPLPVTAAARRA